MKDLPEIKDKISYGAMKETDLVFVDIESTGLIPVIHEIVEIAILRVKQDWSGETPTFTLVEKWEAKVRPENISSADPVSLKISGYAPDLWKNSLPVKEALTIFAQKTEGAIMVAHNVAFDSEFINYHMNNLGIINKMHYHRLDTVSIAYAKLHNLEEVKRFSLGELTKHYGIRHEKAHTAMGDVEADFILFKKLLGAE